MRPKLLLCHLAVGKDPESLREYVTAHRYDGAEWGLDSLRLPLARGRRARMLDGFRLGPLRLSLPGDAPHLEPGGEAIVALRPEAIRIRGGSDGKDGAARIRLWPATTEHLRQIEAAQ
jgi:hypothetical protein